VITTGRKISRVETDVFSCKESTHCNTIAAIPLTSLYRAGRYKSFLPTTKQPSQATRTHLLSHRTTSGSGKWSPGTTSEGIATTQASQAGY
jgi:hypothetical protein